MEKERGLKRAKAERAAKKKRARQRKRALFLVAESLILFLLVFMVFSISKYGKLQVTLWGKNDIATNEGVTYRDYKTIAVFGVDTKKGNLDAGTYADTMLILSIHPRTNEIKAVSVYHDLLVMQNDGKIGVAKDAYYRGGAKEAVNMLNRNFDLTISDYISVDYTAVVNLVDLLGGLEWTLTDEEAAEMNLHIQETANITGNAAGEVHGGLQILDGVKTLTYLRICKNVGGDVERTYRQAKVMEELFKKVQSVDLITLNKIIDCTFTQISTSLTLKETISLVTRGVISRVTEIKGFAFEYKTVTVKGMKNVVVPLGVSENVSELHAFLYGENGYKVTATVQEIAEEMETFTGYKREVSE